LWVQHGIPPWELTSYVLRRDIYHCLPSELDKEPWTNVQADIAMMNAITKVTKR